MKARHRPQKRAFELRYQTKNSKLDSYERETNETGNGHQNSCPSYDHATRHTSQFAPNCPGKPLPQLRHETGNPYLNSYERETNETKISYENNIFSYALGLIPSCKWPQTPPQTTLPQIRHETGDPYLNSYERETVETISIDRAIRFSAAPSFSFVLSEVVWCAPIATATPKPHALKATAMPHGAFCAVSRQTPTSTQNPPNSG